MSMEFVRVKVSARRFGGFADLLLETLERADVNNDEVTFEGMTQQLPGAEGEGWTQIHTVVPYDVRVPEYVPWHEVVAETNMSDVVQTAARRTLRDVHMQLRPRLQDTPYLYLPRALQEPDSDREAFQILREVDYEPDERLRVAGRCILAQDQSLCHVDREVDVLRGGWDKDVLKLEDLERQLRALQTKMAATNSRNELKIATLTARNVSLGETVHRKDEAIKQKNLLLEEKNELIDSMSDGLMNQSETIRRHQRHQKWNVDNLVYLGAQTYYNQDRVARMATAWKRSDRRRITEITEAGEGQPAVLRKKPRTESYVLPTSQCRVSTALPPMLLRSPEMLKASEKLVELLEDDGILYKLKQRVHDPETGPSQTEVPDYSPASDVEDTTHTDEPQYVAGGWSDDDDISP
ncbi:unnamed protein product [Urochloa humidicola]